MTRLKRRTQRPLLPPAERAERDERIIARYLAGETCTTLGRSFELSGARVHQILMRHSVPRRRAARVKRDELSTNPPSAQAPRMKQAKQRTTRVRSDPGRRSDRHGCGLLCGSGLPATRCIAGVQICQPCFDKTKDIEAHPDAYPGQRQREGVA